MSIQNIHQNVFNFLINYHERNSNFFFSFRQLNRGARLEKGYWFLGNDKYVSISFWLGSDNSTRSPRASFIIMSDGSSYLEINSRYEKKQFFTSEFFKKLGFPKINSGEIHRKAYPDFNNNYIESLKSFISSDKIIIDTYVSERKWLIENNDIFTEGIEFIWPETFERQLAKVRYYQSKLAEREKNSGYLRNFYIDNFGPIKNLSINDIPPNCRWIFLTGENGSGKTSILRALAASICNNKDGSNKMVPDYDFKTTIGIDNRYGIEQKTIIGSDSITDKDWLVKGFAGYGPVRLITEGSLIGDLLNLNINRSSRKATQGLFNAIGILRDISGSYVLGVRPKYYEMTLEEFLANIEQNLQLIIPNISAVKISKEGEGHKILYYQGRDKSGKVQEPVDFINLPSGTKNFAALILDLLVRFTEQQQNKYDISDYAGIVLIDEIDLHLHPKLQRDIIVQLSETFPNIQFVVTTHSPIPLLGAPKDSIFINVYKDDNYQIRAKKLDIDITNLLPNSILTSPIFSFDELINENHDPSERLMTEDDYNEAIFYRILEKKLKEAGKNSQL